MGLGSRYVIRRDPIGDIDYRLLGPAFKRANKKPKFRKSKSKLRPDWSIFFFHQSGSNIDCDFLGGGGGSAR